MPFGLSFGVSKTKSSSTKSVDSTVTTDQTQNQSKDSTGVTSSTGTNNQQSSQTGSTTQAGTTGQQTAGQQTSAQTTKSFSDAALGGIEAAVAKLFGTGAAGGSAELGGSFDHAAYVNDAVAGVEQKANTALNTGINSLYDNVGGKDDSNSMVALLANQARADTGGVVAGARASAEGQAQEIERQRYLAGLQGSGQTQSFLANLLGTLKGGVSTTEGQTATNESQSGQSSQTGTSAQAGTSNQQTAQNQVQTLSELLASILKGTEHTVGTEKEKSKGLTIGGGASASF